MFADYFYVGVVKTDQGSLMEVIVFLGSWF